MNNKVKRRFEAIAISDEDNVATALVQLSAKSEVCVSLDSRHVDILVTENIKTGHKLAIKSIEAGEAILKYGVLIGRAITPINIGEHVHTHNLLSTRARKK